MFFLFFHKTRFLTFFILGVNVFLHLCFREALYNLGAYDDNHIQNK